MEAIKIRGLNFSYPRQAKQALKDINLDIKSGEFVCLCGKSGSGKSTLLKHFKKNLAPHGIRSGTIEICSEDIFSMGQAAEAQKIGFVHQSPDNQIVTDKVWHELAFGLESLGYKTEEIRSRVAEMASFFGIQTWFHKEVTTLSGGQKQLLNLASIMVMQPEILILDEPTSQLDPIAATDFLETIKKINSELGTSIVITEHRLEEVLPLADRVLVMQDGSIIADGTPKEVGERLRFIENDMFAAMPTPMRIYVEVPNDFSCPITVKEGRNWLKQYESAHGVDKSITFEKQTDSVIKDKILSMKEVWFRYEKDMPDVLKGLTFDVREGEFFAIVGGNGTGKSTTLGIAAKMRRPYRGEVLLKEGISIGVLPQNPQSLFVKKTVELDLYEVLSDRQLLYEEKESRVEAVIKLCELEELREMHPYDLSGGEQQRAALAKVLLLKPDLLFLDEPTKGLDAHFKLKLARIFKKLNSVGVTLVMVSHDIEFCAAYADRCAMFFDGNITGIDEAREFFCGKNFYTTAASRMSRNILPQAVLVEDVICACNKNYKAAEKKVGDKIDEEGLSLFEDVIYDSNEAENNRDNFFKVKKLVNEEIVKNKRRTAVSYIVAAISALALGITYCKLDGKFVDYRMYLVHLLMFLEIAIGFFAFFPSQSLEIPDYSIQEISEKRRLSKQSKLALLITCILVPFTIYFGTVYLANRKYYFISLLIILESMIPFIISFETRAPKAREIMVIACLAAIGTAGRMAFFMLPQFKPVIAITIIAGVCFGAESGFMVGAIIAFTSNMFFGQSAITPWQMFAYGMTGLAAGILFKKGMLRKTKASLCVFGAIVTFSLCGVILDTGAGMTWLIEPTFAKLIPYYMTGVVFNLIHAFATTFFLWFAAEPLIEKLERIKVKYGLIGN